MAKTASRISWRPQERAGTSAQVLLVARRLAYSLVALGLVVAFAYLVLAPYFYPRTYMVYLTAGNYLTDEDQEPRGGEPLAYTWEDFAALTELRGALSQSGTSPIRFQLADSPESLLGEVRALSGLGLRRQDAIILYVVAHGIVAGNEPQAYLKCANFNPVGFDPANPGPGLVEVSELFTAVAALDGATKLLILDAGRTEYDLHSGSVANTFPRHVQQALQRLDDPSLWVLTANSNLERSYVSPALRRSVFGYVVSRGLRGGADLNDDQRLHLSELYRFVRENVSSWVERDTAGNASQTPLLLSVNAQAAEGTFLLSLDGLPPPDAAADVAQDLKDAQQPESESEVAGVLVFVEDFAGKFGIPSVDEVKQRVSPLGKAASAVAGAIGLGGDEASENGEPQEKGEAAAAGGADGDVEAGDPAAESLDAAAVAQRRLQQAWQLTADLDSATTGPRPRDEAPHLWQELMDQLLWYDRLHHAGFAVDQQLVANELKTIVQQLSSLAGRTPPAALGSSYQEASPRPPADLNEVHSLALAELIAASQKQELPESLRAFVTAFDQALAKEEREELDKLWAEKWDPDWARYDELFAANRLLTQSELPWNLVRQVLQIRRLGEQAAADVLCGSGWGQDTIEGADRLRREAERLIESRADSDWSSKVDRNLLLAREQYVKARQAAATVRQALRRRNEILGQSRSYLRWRGLSYHDTTGVPRAADIENLFQSLQRLDEGLATPGETVEMVQRRLADLEADWQAVLQLGAISRLAMPPFAAGDAWKIEVLMGAAHLSFESRESLRQSLPEASYELASTFQFARPRPREISVTPLSDRDWQFAWRQIRLEQSAARLARTATDDDFARLDVTDGIEKLGLDSLTQQQLTEAGFSTVLQVAQASLDNLAAVKALDDARAAAVRDRARYDSLESAVARLRRFHAELPNRIRVQAETAGTSSPVQRLTRIGQAVRDMQLLDSRSATQLARVNPAQALHQVVWFELLAWHGRRYLEAAADAPDAEAARLLAVAKDYRALALSVPLPGRPSVPAISTPALELGGSSQANLASQEQDAVPLTFDLVGPAEAPVWIVVQYDVDRLVVGHDLLRDDLEQLWSRNDVSRAMYREHALRVALPAAPAAQRSQGEKAGLPRAASQFSAYPYRPDVADLPPTFTLPASGAQRFQLDVSRLEAARGQTKVIVKALGGGSYVRREVEVILPGQQMYRLVVDRGSQSWMRTGDGVVLNPLPNRIDGFTLQIVNETSLARTVSVSISIPQRKTNVDLPQSALSPDDARALLDRFGSRTPLVTNALVSLPANAEPQPVGFAPAPEGEAGPQIASIPQKDADGNDLPGLLLANGLLLMEIRDMETERVTLRRIEFSPQRPRRFLSAVAAYNPAREELEIEFTADDRNVVPEEGLLIRCDFEGIPAAAQTLREVKLGPPEYKARLYARIPAGLQSKVLAAVSVDDYPRAFLFDVTCDVARRNVLPLNDREGVTIVSPSPSTAYPASQASVPVQIQIDGPHNTFEGGGDYFEIGIDENLNRDFDIGERKMRHYLDRQVHLYLNSLETSGNMRFLTRVSDFTLDVPVLGLNNMKAYLLGRVVVSSGSGSRDPVWSDPVELIFDGSGPLLELPRLNPPFPGRQIPLGSEFEVHVQVRDVNFQEVAMSGVSKVEVAFDVDRDGDIKQEKPFEAEPAEDGVWVAKKVKAEKLPLGRHVILIRATDRVENVRLLSPPLEVTLVPPVAAAAESPEGTPEKKVVQRVTGRLAYANAKRFSNISILLVSDENPEIQYEAQVTDSGDFIIDNVASGKYKLEARATANNGVRTTSQPVTVSAQPDTPSRLGTVQLK